MKTATYRVWVLAAALLAAACSSTTGTTDGGGEGGATDGGGGTFACGSMTCAAGRLCVHTIATGGACMIPPDGGACPPGTRGNPGGCCVSFSESYTCADRPSGCDPLACGCAQALCALGTPNNCPCQSGTGAQLECACLYP